MSNSFWFLWELSSIDDFYDIKSMQLLSFKWHKTDCEQLVLLKHLKYVASKYSHSRDGRGSWISRIEIVY